MERKQNEEITKTKKTGRIETKNQGEREKNERKNSRIKEGRGKKGQ